MERVLYVGDHLVANAKVCLVAALLDVDLLCECLSPGESLLSFLAVVAVESELHVGASGLLVSLNLLALSFVAEPGQVLALPR